MQNIREKICKKNDIRENNNNFPEDELRVQSSGMTAILWPLQSAPLWGLVQKIFPFHLWAGACRKPASLFNREEQI